MAKQSGNCAQEDSPPRGSRSRGRRAGLAAGGAAGEGAVEDLLWLPRSSTVTLTSGYLASKPGMTASSEDGGDVPAPDLDLAGLGISAARSRSPDRARARRRSSFDALSCCPPECSPCDRAGARIQHKPVSSRVNRGRDCSMAAGRYPWHSGSRRIIVDSGGERCHAGGRDCWEPHRLVPAGTRRRLGRCRLGRRLRAGGARCWRRRAAHRVRTLRRGRARGGDRTAHRPRQA